MSPNLLQVILHVGSIISLVKDVEKSIGDLVAKKSPGQDLKAVLEDVLSLISSGLINIPGLSQSDLVAVVQEVESSLLAQAVVVPPQAPVVPPQAPVA